MPCRVENSDDRSFRQESSLFDQRFTSRIVDSFFFSILLRKRKNLHKLFTFFYGRRNIGRALGARYARSFNNFDYKKHTIP